MDKMSVNTYLSQSEYFVASYITKPYSRKETFVNVIDKLLRWQMSNF